MIAHPEIDAEGLLAHAAGLFGLGPESCHGPGHWRVVLRNAVALSKAMTIVMAVPVIIALPNDCCGESDWRAPRGPPTLRGNWAGGFTSGACQTTSRKPVNVRWAYLLKTQT